MIVRRLDIRDFRNYTAQCVTFGDGLNILEGDNAQGKTNLVEAVCFTGMGRSPRTPRDRELIRSGADRALMRVEVEGVAGTSRVDVALLKNENKRVAVNGMPITRIGELMGVVSAVFFSPDEMGIIKDGPSDRRRFVDLSLCQMSKAYFYLLNRYNKTISQRNKLLKTGRADDDSLDVWDMQTAACGAKIVRTRRAFIQRLLPHAQRNHAFLTDGKEALRLEYEGMNAAEPAEMEKRFIDELKRARSRDRLVGYTTFGPHKDDLCVAVDGSDVRVYGSQGQQRTAALSLKLAEVDMKKEETGESPVLLLDDVLSELDEKRQIQLIQRLADFQSIVTCTHLGILERCVSGARRFRVQAGRVTET